MSRLRLAFAALVLCAPLSAAPAAAAPHLLSEDPDGHVSHIAVGRRVAAFAGPGTPHDVVGRVTTDRLTASARPDLSGTPTVDCAFSATMCLHYTLTGADAVTASYVDEVETTLAHVSGAYHAAGYRSPDADTSSGSDSNPDGKLDVYLQQLGDSDYYGYCTTTTPASPRGSRDAAAYCVLDNDYTDPIYDRQTPLHNLQVTVAHEYFHAVQFAYDYLEDSWFMEATATWAEDELYTGINDNRQYLTSGPLGHPRLPLDDSAGGSNVYGDWLFFRYLTERIHARSGPLPELVREMWAAAARRDVYSIDAVSAALRSHRTDLRTQFADFADANRHPAISYSEGRAYHPAAPAGTQTLDRAHRQRAGSRVVRHLAAVTEDLRRGDVRGSHLRVTITTPHPALSAARISIWLRDGTITTRRVRMDQRTDTVTVPYGSRVTHAELTLVNASTRYRCHTGDVYSCDGTPLDDDLTLRWSAKVI